MGPKVSRVKSEMCFQISSPRPVVCMMEKVRRVIDFLRGEGICQSIEVKGWVSTGAFCLPGSLDSRNGD